MMTFKAEHIAQIIAGTKTQTRRRLPKSGRTAYWPGQAHACVTSRRERHPWCWIHLTAVRVERLGSISLEDIRREGYQAREEYEKVFAWCYGAWTPDELVQVIDFVRVEAPKP